MSQIEGPEIAWTKLMYRLLEVRFEQSKSLSVLFCGWSAWRLADRLRLLRFTAMKKFVIVHPTFLLKMFTIPFLR
jgi:hypothetical protein